METQQDGNPTLDETSEMEETQEEQQGEKTDDKDESIRYFQSRGDKLADENEKLKKYAEVGKLIEERPDLQQALVGAVNSNKENSRIEISPDDFDPWEAYNNPKSKSYAFRMQEIADVVDSTVGNKMAGMQRGMAMNNLKADLKAKGLNDVEVDDFIKFASTPANELGTDNVIKMFRAVNSAPAIEHNALDQVRSTQKTPTPGGVVQGQKPKVKSDDDAIWDGIMNAGARGNIP